MTLYMDVHEPDAIFGLLDKTALSPVRVPLNVDGFADYMWHAVDGHLVSVERKQWGEVLSSVSDVEEQLRRELRAVDELWLLVEGVAEATPWGVDTYQKSTDKPYWHRGRSYGDKKQPRPQLYSMVESWLWSLDKSGISVVKTFDQAGTARVLAAHYQQGQKQEHTTLSRYIKPKPHLEPYDPWVLTLMGIEGAGLGEVRAKVVASRYHSLIELAGASYSELLLLDGFGPGLARKVLRAIGKE